MPEITPPPYDGSFQAVLAWLDAPPSESDIRWAADLADRLVTGGTRRQMAEAVDELRALEVRARLATDKARGALALANVAAVGISEAVAGRQAHPGVRYRLEDFAFERFFDVSGASAVADWCRRLAEPLNELT